MQEEEMKLIAALVPKEKSDKLMEKIFYETFGRILDRKIDEFQTSKQQLKQSIEKNFSKAKVPKTPKVNKPMTQLLNQVHHFKTLNFSEDDDDEEESEADKTDDSQGQPDVVPKVIRPLLKRKKQMDAKKNREEQRQPVEASNRTASPPPKKHAAQKVPSSIQPLEDTPIRAVKQHEPAAETPPNPQRKPIDGENNKDEEIVEETPLKVQESLPARILGNIALSPASHGVSQILSSDEPSTEKAPPNPRIRQIKLDESVSSDDSLPQPKNGEVRKELFPLEDYGIDDLKSGDETDEDDNPKKIVPFWAEAKNLRVCTQKIHSLITSEQRHKHFGQIAEPNLDAFFGKLWTQKDQLQKKKKQNVLLKDDAKWNSPMWEPRAGTSRLPIINSNKNP